MKLLKYLMITLITCFSIGVRANDNTFTYCANNLCHFNPAHGTPINPLICPSRDKWSQLDIVDQRIFGYERLAYSYEAIKSTPDKNEYVMHNSYKTKCDDAVSFFNQKKADLVNAAQRTESDTELALIIAVSDRLDAYIRILSQPMIRYRHQLCPGAIVSKRAIMCIMQWISSHLCANV